METITIDGKEVGVASLPPEVQTTIENIARNRLRLKDLTTQLNEVKILHEFYNSLLKNQVIEYLKEDAPI